MLTAKIFMSDMHLGADQKADDFSPEKDQILANVLGKLCEKYDTESELVLLGDIFDLIEHRDNDPLEVLKLAVKKHKVAIDALRDWLKTGRKLFYITGNHDHAVRHPRVAEFLADTLIVDNTVEWGHFVVDDWYASKSFRIYAEHGNRFDPDNNHAGRDTCFGDKIVKKILLMLEGGHDNPHRTDKKWRDPFGYNRSNPFEFIDNARPRGNMLLLVDKLIEEGYLKKGTKDALKKQLLDVYKENPNVSTINKFVINNLSFLIGDGTLKANLDDHYLPYQNSAREMMDEANKNNIMILRDLSFKPNYIVMGHTHFFDTCVLTTDCEYINLASWLDTIYIDHKGKMAEVMKNTPVLVFEKQQQGIKHLMYDANDTELLKRELDWDELNKIRERFGIPVSDYKRDELPRPDDEEDEYGDHPDSD